ncbi:MAG: hypothetical protein M3Q65_17740, partial [Chloroflexota bacterium]|nr:hypothetical protein [Chloroflexota bacterium]
RYEQGRQIEVHADPPLPVEFDGDPAGTTPFIAEILPGALTVLSTSPLVRHAFLVSCGGIARQTSPREMPDLWRHA